ncbi:hypothetical protein EV658_1302 [Phaeovulum veldkampii DSM 11550]|nr:hypothetical protein EV658_1302 [Phaeovulum veldkampii DSM 11550]
MTMPRKIRAQNSARPSLRFLAGLPLLAAVATLAACSPEPAEAPQPACIEVPPGTIHPADPKTGGKWDPTLRPWLRPSC